MIENRNRASVKPKLLDQARFKLHSERYNQKTINNRFNKYSPVEFAAYCLKAIYEIKTLQVSLKHASLKTAMIYTHEFNIIPGVRSPLD